MNPKLRYGPQIHPTLRDSDKGLLHNDYELQSPLGAASGLCCATQGTPFMLYFIWMAPPPWGKQSIHSGYYNVIFLQKTATIY